jgi:hypothetical protein
VDLGPLAGGERRRLRLQLRADEPVAGAQLQAQVGEARSDARLDAFGTDRWRFFGPRAEDTRGWRACDGSALRTDLGFQALLTYGCADSPPWTRILDADGLRVELRAEAHNLRLSWDGGAHSVSLRGDGELETFTLDLRNVAGWSDDVGAVRVSADGPLALVRLEAIGLGGGPRPVPEPGPDPDSPEPPPGDEPPFEDPEETRWDAGTPAVDDGGLAATPTSAERSVRQGTFSGGCAQGPTPPPATWLCLLLPFLLRHRRPR